MVIYAMLLLLPSCRANAPNLSPPHHHDLVYGRRWMSSSQGKSGSSRKFQEVSKQASSRSGSSPGLEGTGLVGWLLPWCGVAELGRGRAGGEGEGMRLNVSQMPAMPALLPVCGRLPSSEFQESPACLAMPLPAAVPLPPSIHQPRIHACPPA